LREGREENHGIRKGTVIIKFKDDNAGRMTGRKIQMWGNERKQQTTIGE
jgi:hypothetical protein